MHRFIPLFALLVALIVPWASARAEEKAHDCLVVVMDGSGSMSESMSDGGTRMVVAKAALQKVLAKVPPDTWIGVVVFSNGVRNEWVVPLGPRQTDMPAKINAVVEGGSTPLGEYIKKGADALVAERERQFNLGQYRLIVVTDGAATDGNLMNRYAPEVVERGIRLDVIGLAMEDTHALAAMADSYQPAQNADQLDRALAKVMQIESSSNPAQAGGDDFAVVSALPDDAVLGIIKAVAGPKGNWPIGEGAPKPPPVADAAAPAQSATVAQPQAPAGGCDAAAGIGVLSFPLFVLTLGLLSGRRARHIA